MAPLYAGFSRDMAGRPMVGFIFSPDGMVLRAAQLLSPDLVVADIKTVLHQL